MRKLNIYVLLSLLMTLPLLSSCIKEDLDDCKGKVSLLFRYVGDGTTDIFPEKIDKVTLFVYTADGSRLVEQHEYDKQDLSSYQGARLELFPGRYKVVCWGNAFGQTTIRESERKIAAPGYFNQKEITTNDPLYYGTVDLDVPGSLAETTYTCDFVSSHIKVQVRMEGFVGAVVPGVPDGSTVALGMTELPAFTDFGNAPSAAERTTYYPSLTIAADDATTCEAHYNTLRFSEDNDILLQVLAGAGRTVVEEFSLADFIRRYGIRVDGRNEVTISILLRASSVGVEIIDWGTEHVDPGFDKGK